MKITIEIRNHTFYVYKDDHVLAVRVEVLVDGEPNHTLERIVCIDEFRSHFDIIWEEMGTKIKKTFLDLKEPYNVE